ncbi:MAG TPA: FAD:protein FMN transferase [Steroidobacteraceae bacterium]|nr:FAD:protein FMN transferase [Steroidobacteraceae bacterium]
MAAMGTVVSIEVDAPEAAVMRAFEWFRQVEAVCSRFDAASELRQLPVGVATQASPILFEAVRFALKVAEETQGAFDPTIGSRMAARGYNRHYLTGVTSDARGMDDASFRDVRLDTECHTILLKRPLTMDLGAVAKGLAVDAAARELQPFRDFCIDAGGDIYFGGRNSAGEPWRVGIRHPRMRDELVDRLQVSDCAVCTSGDYERGGHILDPRDDAAACRVASATVIAPNAMLADALATAAFVLGPEQGIALLDRMGVEGLLITPTLERYRTANFGHA